MKEEPPQESPDKTQDKSWIDKIVDLFSTTPKTREEVNQLLESALENELIGVDEFSIIEGAMEVTEIQARDVMVPKTSMTCVELDAKPSEFIKTIIQSGHSRFPVVNDNPDDIVGILHAKDLLSLVLDDNLDNFNMTSYIRPVFKVPESKRLNKLLRSFRETRNHMAIVIDEYGSVSGLVTIEDILEEIVGEIEDEFDVAQDEPVKKLGDNDFIIKAHMTIEDFNDTFKTRLNSEADTIAGMVTQQIGHVPQPGESVNIDDILFKVIHSDNRRLHLLRVFTRQLKKRA